MLSGRRRKAFKTLIFDFETRSLRSGWRTLTSAINSGYYKDGTLEIGSDSIVRIDIDLLGSPGTVEEFASVVTFSVDGSLLAIDVLLAISWSVKRTAMLFHLQHTPAFSELQRFDLAWWEIEHVVLLVKRGKKFLVIRRGLFDAIQLGFRQAHCLLIDIRLPTAACSLTRRCSFLCQGCGEVGGTGAQSVNTFYVIAHFESLLAAVMRSLASSVKVSEKASGALFELKGQAITASIAFGI